MNCTTVEVWRYRTRMPGDRFAVVRVKNSEVIEVLDGDYDNWDDAEKSRLSIIEQEHEAK